MSAFIEVTNHLRNLQIDGWLLYYFDHNNPHAFSFLKIPSTMHISRRCFYWIPAKGDPVKIVHAIESHILAHLPGNTLTYDSKESLERCLGAVLKSVKTVAMEYSSHNALPYISKVDAGTIEMIRAHDVRVVSSAPFLIYFTSTLSQSQIASQQKAAQFLSHTAQQLWFELELGLMQGKKITEYQVQMQLLEHFAKHDFVTDYPPICAFGVNTANPHYTPSPERCETLKPNMLIMLDIFCRTSLENSIYGDITKMGFSGALPPKKIQEVFSHVSQAQHLAYALLSRKLMNHHMVAGCELDKVARDYLKSADLGQFFTHRLGHNIHNSLHGPGTHLDSFETLDDRPLIPSTCFSIEPGVYIPGEFGIRLEYDVLILADNTPKIEGGVQRELTSFDFNKKELTMTPSIL